MDISQWIKWEGGECPVNSNNIISIKYRNKVVVRRLLDDGWLDWTHNGDIYDIVEYMVEES